MYGHERWKMVEGATVLVALGVLTGCVPQVTHGPRVERGTTGVMNLSAMAVPGEGLSPSEGEAGAVLYGGARHGWVAEDGTMAASLGVQAAVMAVPLHSGLLSNFASSTQADLYVQLERSAQQGREYGVGVLGSKDLVMPYTQFGATRGNGNAWYTTQGIAITTRGSGSTVWMPSVSWRDAADNNGRAVTWTAGSAIDLTGRAEQPLLVLSVTTEFGLDRR